MIEAVNALASNAPLVRASTDQVDVARSFAANPDRLQEAPATPKAPYVSPYIAWDNDYNKAVLQFRNGDTGDVVQQYPSDSTLALRARTGEGTAETPELTETPTVSAQPQQTDAVQANAAQAQAAAAALARSAQAAQPQIATVITSA